MADSNFRSDINGLRAWAVSSVILYHFGVPGFGGGFVGVDVFFVISGFLMTGIVVGGLERAGGGFSVWAFYMARARRILPALITMCAVLLALGWAVLLAPDFKALGTHVLFSLAFLSNIKFWKEAGYFDAASHEKWLLHTWSLAVEWQFYLLLPLILVALWNWRPGRRPVIAVMVAALLGSLVLSVVGTNLWPTATFYMLHSRAWEMLAGGLVYLLGLRLPLTTRHRIAIEVFAFALMIVAIIGFDASSPWPGWRALVPVFGAVGVLLAGRANSLWTGHPVAQWLGTRSYSLYLWHWPIVVALSYLRLQTEPPVIAAALLLTLILGGLSYRCVEAPSRVHLGRLRPSFGAAALLGATVAVAASGGGIRMKEGAPARFSAEIEITRQEALNSNPRKWTCYIDSGYISPSCIYGGTELGAIVLGDSHADAVVTAVAAAAPRPETAVMQWSYSACPTIENVHSRIIANWQCPAFIDWTIKKLEQVPREIPVIIVNRHAQYAIGSNEDPVQRNVPQVFFSRPYATPEPAFLDEYARGLVDTACHLAKSRPVYLVRPIPEMGVSVPKTARPMAFGIHQDVSVTLAEYHRRHAFIWAAQDTASERCGVRILDPLPFLCLDGRCYGKKDGRPIYYDDDHLSEYGNKLLVPMFQEVFAEQ